MDESTTCIIRSEWVPRGELHNCSRPKKPTQLDRIEALLERIVELLEEDKPVVAYTLPCYPVDTSESWTFDPRLGRLIPSCEDSDE